MSFTARRTSLLRGAVAFCAAVTLPSITAAQRDVRLPPATQGFAASECRPDCALDSLIVDIDRARRGQPGVVTVSLLLVDTVALARRGAPPVLKERTVPVYATCDVMPCAAAVLTGRLSDKRIDDARVVRRTQIVWPMPAASLLRIARASAMMLSVDGKSHVVNSSTMAAMRALVESVKSSLVAVPPSPRLQLYMATFALFGVPADSTMAEDVGTATEPLMMPDATTSLPTRVATLTMIGRGIDAMPLLVQDDGTGAAPIFGVNEQVAVVLPGRTGRRGIVSATVLARQRVEVMRDACQGMKVWTYLVAMSPAALQLAQRGMLASPRPGEGVDRWNGVAVREVIAARVTPAEQRTMTASRAAVAQFVRERAASGVRAGDVQILAALPRNGGVVTNFGTFLREANGVWRFPTFALRSATCP